MNHNKRLMIIGAGGHARVCTEIAGFCGYTNVCYLDDCPARQSESSVAGSTGDYEKYLDDSDFFVALGDNRLRRTFQERIIKSGGRIVTLIHPYAVVSGAAVIGKGTVVMPGAVINPGAVIGDGVIINTSSSVDHDCKIGDFSHIAVGAHLAGLVNVGENTFIGAGGICVNNISIPGDAVIGAGAVVNRTLTCPGTYVGVPARRIK